MLVNGRSLGDRLGRLPLAGRHNDIKPVFLRRQRAGKGLAVCTEGVVREVEIQRDGIAVGQLFFGFGLHIPPAVVGLLTGRFVAERDKDRIGILAFLLVAGELVAFIAKLKLEDVRAKIPDRLAGGHVEFDRIRIPVDANPCWDAKLRFGIKVRQPLEILPHLGLDRRLGVFGEELILVGPHLFDLVEPAFVLSFRLGVVCPAVRFLGVAHSWDLPRSHLTPLEAAVADHRLFIRRHRSCDMADLNPIAKRIHNVTPEPVRLTLADGTEAVFEFEWTEFFQQEFQAEGHRSDDDADYRLISSEDNADILVGRQPTGEDDWEMLGAITAAEAADGDTDAAPDS